MSELCRAWPCWVDLSFCGRWAQASQMHEPNREPTPEGAAVSTTSGNCFSDHILPAKPLHRSLFSLFLTNYSLLHSLYLEWEESCLQILGCLCAHYMVHNLNPWLLFNSSTLGWDQRRGWVGLPKVPACGCQTYLFLVLAEKDARVYLWYRFTGSKRIMLNVCNTDGDLMWFKCSQSST